MCGIAGFCDFSKKSDKQTLINMTDRLYHRGPDDSGYSFYEKEFVNIGLGHRRLSILDLSTHGHQPMLHENLEIIFNGEVYNFAEIAEELKKYGYIFKSNSDTEVILKAYHKWGIEATNKFNGMFSIVLYDKVKLKLFFIRDRTGVKPFYWYKKGDLIMFASELKSFYENHLFEKVIDYESVALYLQYGYIPQPKTIFENAYKLKPGHILEIDLKNKEVKEKKYWDVFEHYKKPKYNLSESEIITKTEELLVSSCNYRMISDVPVGMFLSGGYDSSAVTALIQNNSKNKIKTFTIGFDDAKYNEAIHAKKVAEYLGTDHTEYYCTHKDVLTLIPSLFEIWDEPFGDSSSLPTLLVSKLAKKEVTVSLSSDGGDELFGGYEKYTRIRNLDKIPIKQEVYTALNFINLPSFYFFKKIPKFSRRYNKIKDIFNYYSPLKNLSLVSSVFTPNEITQLLNKSSLILVDKDFFTNNFTENTRGLSCIDSIMSVDYTTYLNDDILTKVDRATMSVSLEGREPLLDYRLIEFLARIDEKIKFKNGEKKYILKEIVHKYIPKKIMNRPKMGFSLPLENWLHKELKELVNYYLDDERIKNANIFNVNFVRNLKQEFFTGKNEKSEQIWYLLSFEMWREKWY